MAIQELGDHPDYIAALLAAPAEATVMTEGSRLGWRDMPRRVLCSAVAVAEARRQGSMSVCVDRWAGVLIASRPTSAYERP